jgi:hypothetical protein
MSQTHPRFPLLALIIGLLAGLAAGLFYAWFVNPVTFVNISPDQLRVEDQREYVLLVAESYAQDNDLEHAQDRLRRLGMRDPVAWVALQADDALLTGAPADRVRALATLAEALGAEPMAAEVFSGTSAPTSPPAAAEQPSPTFEGMPSPTSEAASVTASPAPTAGVPTATPDLFPETDLSLSAREILCEDEIPSGQIQVWVFDEAGRGIPAIQIRVEWDGGEDTFYTGLKPAISPGYADFQMEADREYTVTLVDLAEPVVGIESAACTTPSGAAAIPTYRLTFIPAEPLEDEAGPEGDGG